MGDFFSPQHLILIIILISIPTLIIFLVRRSTSNKKKAQGRATNISSADELEKLFLLKEKGAITQEEFDVRKSKLL